MVGSNLQLSITTLPLLKTFTVAYEYMQSLATEVAVGVSKGDPPAPKT